MLGSFSYSVPLKDLIPKPVSTLTELRPLLADVFSANYRLGEFNGNYFPKYSGRDGCIFKGTCEYPERVWFVYTDGSLKVERNPKPVPIQEMKEGGVSLKSLFSWPGLFERQMNIDAKSQGN